jgi:dolichol kinase
MGVAAGTVYGAFVTHTQAAYILGFAVSILYLLDQIRVKYPEIAERITGFNSLLVRAEERLKESSSVPYAIACTLCVLSFPKPVALIAIFTVALADPIAAIVGISHGKRVLVGRKTLEGSLAFFTTTLVISFSILLYYTQSWKVLIAAPMISFLVSMLELIPMRLDDNLLIPLYASFVSLAVASAFGLGL